MFAIVYCVPVRKAIYVCLYLLLASQFPVHAQVTSLVRDIENQSASQPTATGSPFLIGQNGLLTLEEIRFGKELYKRDGTTGALEILKDILPGAASSNPEGFWNFAGTVIFTAMDGSGIREFWRTDGLASGTVPFFAPWSGGKLEVTKGVWPVGSYLFFEGRIGTDPIKLWRTDGSVAGTIPLSVQTIESGSRKSLVVGNTFYFVSTSASAGSELWKSSGTAAGTVMVKDIESGASGSRPELLFALGSSVYLAAATTTYGNELWKSNGTAAGTTLVKDIHPIYSSNPGGAVVHNGLGLFWATDPTGGTELWKTDGTTTGTTRVKDINPGTAYGTNYIGLTIGPGGVYFTANDGVHGMELWKTDGTELGTVMVKDIREGAGESLPGGRMMVGDVLYFSAYDGVHGSELWRSDGTEGGTWMVCDIRPGWLSSYPSPLGAIGNRLIFEAKLDGTNATRWESDGTEAGTRRNAEYSLGTASSDPSKGIHWKGKLWFAAQDTACGRELWWTDGISADRVTDLNPGISGSDPEPLGVVGGHLLFAATTAIQGRELWRIHGVTGQAELVMDVFPGTYDSAGSPYWSSPQMLFCDGDRLFFTASALYTGRELWCTDGTTAGTRLVREFGSGSAEGGVTGVAKCGAAYFITAYSAPYVHGFWVSDGTSAATALLGSKMYASQFFAFGPSLAFTNQGELYRTDGTVSGTSILKEFTPGQDHGGSYESTGWNGLMWMSVYETVGKSQIWKTDGTMPGTSVLASYGDGTSLAANLCGTPAAMFFAGGTSVSGRELWKTDATGAGASMVAELTPGSVGTTFNWIHSSGSGVYFSIASTASGKELWRSDGTSAGTVLADDIVPGNGESKPQPMGMVNGRFVFAADSPVYGREPRSIACGGPVIVVENDGGFEAPPVGWTMSLPLSSSGEETTRVWRVRNIGDAPASALTMDLSAEFGSGFSVDGSLPAMIMPGDSVELTARFAPASTGQSFAAVRIRAGDTTQVSFNLFGWAHAISDTWRMEHFGWILPIGAAEEAADPDGDGRSNLLERALGSSPEIGDPPAVLRNDTVSGYYMYERVPPVESGCAIVPEWSSSLTPGSWSSLGLEQRVRSIEDDREQVEISLPVNTGPRCFLRLRVVEHR